MDEFGVLTEQFGLKPQGKSAPMSAAKHPPGPTTAAPNPNSSSSFYPVNSGKFVDDFDVFEGFPLHASKEKNSSIDYIDSVFSGGGSATVVSDDGLFGSFFSTTQRPSSGVVVDDLLGGFGVDDLLGGFGVSSKLKPPPPLPSSGRNGSLVSGGFDDLMPGFGSSSKAETSGTKKTTFASFDDPFVVLESTSVATVNSTFMDPLEDFSNFIQSGSRKTSESSHAALSIKPPPKAGQVLKTDKGMSSIDELENFAKTRVRNDKEAKEKQNGKASKYKEAEDAARKNQQKSPEDLDSIFGTVSRSSSVPKSRVTSLDLLFDAEIYGSVNAETVDKKSSGASGSFKASVGNMVDELSSIFVDASFFGELGEFEGESEERRKARLGRHQRTQDRVAKAVADMNQRDLQTQHEQEERRRIAEQMDVVIKRWSAGKEGNLRALLSSLHNVLWPECCWEPVSLTDIVTPTSVKKVYRKATLCVHPDKVQQKGATLYEKYTAEKVFNVLKEAWKKFNRDELR